MRSSSEAILAASVAVQSSILVSVRNGILLSLLGTPEAAGVTVGFTTGFPLGFLTVGWAVPVAGSPKRLPCTGCFRGEDAERRLPRFRVIWVRSSAVNSKRSYRLNTGGEKRESSISSFGSGVPTTGEADTAVAADSGEAVPELNKVALGSGETVFGSVGAGFGVTLTMLLGFSALSIYFTVSGIYRMGKEEGERLQIEHIEQMKLHQQADSVPYPVREGSGSNNVIK